MGERSGTAVPLQAQAVPPYWNGGFVLAGDGMAVPLQARAVPSFCHFRLKFFFFRRFLESISDNYLRNNLKQTKSD